MRLTPDDVRSAKFRSVKRGKRGYDEHQVDAFLDRVEATLRGEDTLTADVVNVKFDPRQRRKFGYVQEDVDAFLDKVAKELRRGDTRRPRRKKLSAPSPHPAAPTHPSVRPVAAPSPPRSDPPPAATTQVLTGSFQGANPDEPAYDATEVDAFMERVEATLRGQDTLTAQDLLTVRFSPARAGGRRCQKPGVDAFLIQVALSLKQLSAPKPSRVHKNYARNPATPPHLPRRESTAPRLIAEELRDIKFSCPPAGQPAYDATEVDAFLDRVEATLRGQDSLTGEDVAMVTFKPPPPGHRGYDESEVEALFELIEERLMATSTSIDRRVTPSR
jgi:DivIVA domain-containing protein